MMKKNDIQKNEIAINKNIENLDARKKIKKMKKKMSKMQNNK